MFKKVVLVGIFLACVTGAMFCGMMVARQPLPRGIGFRTMSVPAALTPVADSQEITDLSSATSLTVPTGAVVALVQAQGGNIRWRDDGTSPDSSTGHVIYAGDTWSFNSDLSAIELIEESSADAFISYYKWK